MDPEANVETQENNECKCMEVLLAVLSQLVKHWKAAENEEKQVQFLVKVAAASIATDDNIMVKDLLLFIYSFLCIGYKFVIILFFLCQWCFSSIEHLSKHGLKKAKEKTLLIGHAVQLFKCAISFFIK